MEERVRRAVRAIVPNPKTIAGMIQTFTSDHERGTTLIQCNVTANTIINTIPMGLVKHLNNTVKKIRNFGMDDGSQRGNMLPDRGVPSTFSRTSRIRFIPENVL